MLHQRSTLSIYCVWASQLFACHISIGAVSGGPSLPSAVAAAAVARSAPRCLSPSASPTGLKLPVPTTRGASGKYFLTFYYKSSIKGCKLGRPSWFDVEAWRHLHGTQSLTFLSSLELCVFCVPVCHRAPLFAFWVTMCSDSAGFVFVEFCLRL